MGFLDLEHPAVWDDIAQVQAGLWSKQRWSDASITSAWLLMRQIDPRIVVRALAEIANEGGDRARFAPEPGEVAERARQIVARERLALSPPEAPSPPDDHAEVIESFERWAAGQSPERLAEARELLRRLRAARRPADRAQVMRDLLDWRRPPAGPSLAAGGGAELHAPAGRAPDVPISAAAAAEVEMLVRAGQEGSVPPRYRHLIPAIKARLASHDGPPRRTRRTAPSRAKR